MSREVSEQKLDDAAAIDRLAKLPLMDYERVRKVEAENLDIRIEILDALVRKARGDSEQKGQGQAIEFPGIDPHPEPVDGAAMLDQMTTAIRRYVVLPEFGAEACALWAAMTWVAGDMKILPLLRVLSPTRSCGKSTLIEVMGEMVNRPLQASGVSPAWVFRVIELHGPTLLLDEVDTYMRESDEHRQLINAGHNRAGAFVGRVVGEDLQPRRFSVFCPKLLAGIGALPGTIEDRAIRILMRKRAPGEVIASLRRHGKEQFEVVRQMLRRFTDDRRNAICKAKPEMPYELADRQADNWEPLVAIADEAGGRWPIVARRAALALTVNDDVEEQGRLLLGDIRDVFAEVNETRIATRDLIEKLNNMEERPWREANRGHEINGHWLGRRLKEFLITSKTVRLENGETLKGYKREDFEDAFSRWLPPPQASHRHNGATARDSDHSQASHNPPAVTDVNGLKLNGGAGCDGVTDNGTPNAGGEDVGIDALIEQAAKAKGIPESQLRATLCADDYRDPKLMSTEWLTAQAEMLAREANG